MAYATTSPFAKTTMAVETTPGGGTYATLCGITQWNYQESTQLDETEVPDCSDLTKPLEVQRAVRSLGAQANCTGVWALTSHQTILGWSRSGATKNVQITFGVVTDSGQATDTETLTGPAYMSNLQYTVQYGSKVEASFDLVFDGLPTAVVKGA